MAKKKPARKPTRKSPRRRPVARKPERHHTTNPAEVVDAAFRHVFAARASERTRFVSLDSPEPGQVHIRADSIEVISHPVQRQAGSEWSLYVTLASGQKTLILDTPENRDTLGIPPQPPDVGATPATPRAQGVPAGWKPPYNPRAPRLRRPGKLAPPQAPDPNAEPQVRDENEDDHE